MASNTAPLSGAALLARYDELKNQGLAHKDIAVECGYYSVNEKDGPRKGQVRARTSSLNAALLVAKGIDLGVEEAPQTTSRNRSIIKTSGCATVASAT